MEDIIIVAVILIIVAAAALYVYKAKKRGVKCIGCPSGESCGGKCGEGCSCHTEENE